jgi:hypothetical protein
VGDFFQIEIESSLIANISNLENMPIKIAISGCAGIGKTTLAKVLSERLKLPLIEELYEPLFNPPGRFNGPPRQIADAFLQIFNTKKQLEEQHGSFVTDRCPVDLCHLWMKRGLSVLEQETEVIFEQGQQQVAQYDLLVILPAGVLEFVTEHEAGDSRRRAASQYIQMYNHASIIGLATLWMPKEHFLCLPKECQSVEERVEAVQQALQFLSL